MVNYGYGKIYKITSEKNGLVYYGSTCRYYLSQRLSKHKSNYKCYLNGKGNYVTSYKVLECDDYKIELIKNFPCVNKKQLETEEANYIRNNACVNIQIPGRTIKEYHEDNKERQKKYYQDNKEKYKQNGKEFREQNKEYNKEYFEQNKEHLKELKSKPYTCECGTLIQWCEKARHFRTKKHCEYINNL